MHEFPIVSALEEKKYPRLYRLYRDYWKQPNKPLVQQCQYEGNTHGIINFPRAYQAMPLLTSARPDAWDNDVINGILIRDEYILAVSAAINASKNLYNRKDFPVKTDGDRPDATPQEFHNPFLEILPDDLICKGTFVFLGHPGSGKTIMLQLLLALRLQAGLPTLIHFSPNEFFLFKDEGVFLCITNPARFANFAYHLPASTWILVDSNEEVVSVPRYIQGIRFLVQAASPRLDCLQWMNKMEGIIAPVYYWIKPWTLRELIIGAALQEPQPLVPLPTLEEIIEFYKYFGPSARLVYLYSKVKKDFTTMLNQKIKKIRRGEIEAMKDDASVGNLSHHTSHYLFLLEPSTGRATCTVSFPTRYVAQIVSEHMQVVDNLSTSQIFRLFIGNTVGCAGYILDGNFHQVLGRGSNLSLSKMAKKSDCIMQVSTTIPRSSFCIGYNDHTFIATEGSVNLDPSNFKDLATQLYLPGTMINPLTRSYYWPSYRSQETFDSFIYDDSNNTKTAFILQATIGTTHSFKPGGIDYLRSLGTTEFFYIAVTTQTELEIPVPKIWMDANPDIEMFHLRLADFSILNEAEPEPQVMPWKLKHEYE